MSLAGQRVLIRAAGVFLASVGFALSVSSTILIGLVTHFMSWAGWRNTRVPLLIPAREASAHRTHRSRTSESSISTVPTSSSYSSSFPEEKDNTVNQRPDPERDSFGPIQPTPPSTRTFNASDTTLPPSHTTSITEEKASQTPGEYIFPNIRQPALGQGHSRSFLEPKSAIRGMSSDPGNSSSRTPSSSTAVEPTTLSFHTFSVPDSAAHSAQANYATGEKASSVREPALNRAQSHSFLKPKAALRRMASNPGDASRRLFCSGSCTSSITTKKPKSRTDPYEAPYFFPTPRSPAASLTSSSRPRPKASRSQTLPPPEVRKTKSSSNVQTK